MVRFPEHGPGFNIERSIPTTLLYLGNFVIYSVTQHKLVQQNLNAKIMTAVVSKRHFREFCGLSDYTNLS